MRTLLIPLILLTLLSCGYTPPDYRQAREVKNIILMIPDGMSVGGTTLTRWYLGGELLAMDPYACGLVRTYSADSPIADSAPAATAMATGFKSKTGYIGVLSDKVTMYEVPPLKDGDAKRPVANILEASKMKGKATGLVYTSEFIHATPAAFSAHYPDRKAYDILSKHQVYNQVDVMLGGGYKYMFPEGRGDNDNLMSIVKGFGYEIVTNTAEMKASRSRKLWGLFAPAEMRYDMDRNPTDEPALHEMTEKAIEILSQNPNGFFLMVEGTQIDWAAHANDPVGIISEIAAFHLAVKAALDFAQKDGNTVVIVASDHGNSGITIGNQSTSSGYDKTTLDTFLAPIRKAKMTGNGTILNTTTNRTNSIEIMSNDYGITDMDELERDAVENIEVGKMNYAIGPIIAKRARIGFTTTGHTGEDVVLYVYSPDANKLQGLIQNTDIARYIERLFRLDLQKTTDELFIEADKALSALGASTGHYYKDEMILSVNISGKTFLIPAHKNIIIAPEQTTNFFAGFSVYNGSKWYLPKTAIDFFKK